MLYSKTNRIIRVLSLVTTLLCLSLSVPACRRDSENTVTSETQSTPILTENAQFGTTAVPTSPLTAAPTPLPSPTSQPTPSPTPTPTPQPASEIDWYEGFADPRTIIPTEISDPDDIDVLVNKYYSIPENYVPELVEAESSSQEKIRPEVNDPWNQMRQDCEDATGYTLYLCDGYRTFEEQAALFERSTARNGIAYCCSKNALEGRSEHNLGLALDISTTDVCEISSGFADTTAGAWVSEHCFEYGFIMRYTKDKTMITGYAYEPWHYRYVGIDLAKELYDNNLSLEEYYDSVPELPEA